MNLISDNVKKIVEIQFEKESDLIVAQLQEFCEFLSKVFSTEVEIETYERYCFAVLKLAESSSYKLHKAIDLGKMDYRDLLMSAGFGESLSIHNEWARSFLK